MNTNMEAFKTIAALNWSYLMGRMARLDDVPACHCPNFFDELHRAEWLRGYREQEVE